MVSEETKGSGFLKADSHRWDGRLVSQSHRNAVLSLPVLECCYRGWDAVCWLGLSKQELTKAQAAGYSSLTGYLFGSSMVDTQPVPGSQRGQWFCTSGPILGLPSRTKSDMRPTQKFGSFLRHI